MIGASKQSSQRTAFEIPADYQGKGKRTGVGTVLLALAIPLFATGVRAGQRELNLNRSLYVPVRFVACPHVANVTMSVHGDDMVFPLGLRTFLFTYYADRKEVLPKAVDVRIKGEELNGRPFATNVVIEPGGARSAVDSGTVDLESVKKQVLIRRDIRFPLQQIFITYTPDCEKQPATAVDSAEPTEPAEAASQTSAPATEAPAGSLH